MAAGVNDPSSPACLIVNADDYGYFPGVSRGIIQAHQNGVVTATGVLANGGSFEDDLRMLLAQPRLDTGVHLSVTSGSPLGSRMKHLLPPNTESFPGKGWFIRGFLTRRIRSEDVADEWRAQIERCLEHGLNLQFLNSHEHMHMFPSMFELIQSLAADYGVPYVRFCDAGRPRHGRASDVFRCAALRGLASLNRRRLVMPAPRFLGAEDSGRLSQGSLSTILGSLEPGRVYELMCHPGYGDEAEGAARQVRDYHCWEAELECLTSQETRMLCGGNNIRLVGYRDLAGLAVGR